LCEKAREAIRASGANVRVTEVDVDGDAELRERYTNDVPVVHVNGSEAFRHRVDPKQFASYVDAGLRGWRVVKGHELEKGFAFPDFAQALAFTNRVGAIAQERNHHPDIHLSWGKVRVVTWSHDVDGLSARDFDLARRIG
jgi:4a-hydroxytetrahydrobiopterin dehydratase